MADAETAKKPAAKKPAQPRRSSRVKANEEVARSYFAALAARDAEGMASHWAEDGVDDLVPLQPLRGPAEVRASFTELFAAMPDLEATVERVTADHEGAAVQWRIEGTFDGGPFQGIEPTGRRVQLRGADCLVIGEDCKLTHNTAYYDGAAFARDIGMLPPQDSSAEKLMRGGFNAVTKLRAQVAARK